MPQAIEVPEAAKQALRRGNKIEAIKIVREQWGIGLAEAKEAVEQAERGADPRPQGAAASRDGKFPLEAIMALKKGDKISAIKIVRTTFGLGLKEAKDAVETHVAQDSVLRAEMESVVQHTRPGKLPWILAILLIGGLIVYFASR